MDVIIGKPLISPDNLGFENSICTNERYLPRLLVNIGYFKSISQVRKNRPDLCITLDEPDMLNFRIGKRHLWILVGETKKEEIK